MNCDPKQKDSGRGGGLGKQTNVQQNIKSLSKSTENDYQSIVFPLVYASISLLDLDFSQICPEAKHYYPCG